MCSLSYIPHEGGFSLSHNRDELPLRKTSSDIKHQEKADSSFYFPQDLQAGGTWMAANHKGMAACLLNGGSKDYLRKLPYRQSRGLVILELMENADVESFKNSFDSNGIEPFTLIIAEEGRLVELVHNPNEDLWRDLDPNEAHFWSSTKLYAPTIREAREKRFRKWLIQNPKAQAKDIQGFHLQEQISKSEGGLVLPKDFPLSTVSFCQFDKGPSSNTLLYLDRLNRSKDSVRW